MRAFLVLLSLFVMGESFAATFTCQSLDGRHRFTFSDLKSHYAVSAIYTGIVGRDEYPFPNRSIFGESEIYLEKHRYLEISDNEDGVRLKARYNSSRGLYQGRLNYVRIQLSEGSPYASNGFNVWNQEMYAPLIAQLKGLGFIKRDRVTNMWIHNLEVICQHIN